MKEHYKCIAHVHVNKCGLYLSAWKYKFPIHVMSWCTSLVSNRCHVNLSGKLSKLKKQVVHLLFESLFVSILDILSVPNPNNVFVLGYIPIMYLNLNLKDFNLHERQYGNSISKTPGCWGLNNSKKLNGPIVCMITRNKKAINGSVSSIR